MNLADPEEKISENELPWNQNRRLPMKEIKGKEDKISPERRWLQIRFTNLELIITIDL